MGFNPWIENKAFHPTFSFLWMLSLMTLTPHPGSIRMLQLRFLKLKTIFIVLQASWNYKIP
jgi:hypothetical protein